MHLIPLLMFMRVFSLRAVVEFLKPALIGPAIPRNHKVPGDKCNQN